MEKLPAKEGYSVDIRTPRRDGIAMRYVNRWFGKDYLDRVLNKYHRAEVSHEAIRDDFMCYDRSYLPSKVRSDPVYHVVIASVRRDFMPKEKLVPLTLGAVCKAPEFPKDRSPGLPYSQQGFKTKGEVLEDPVQRRHMFGLWDNVGKGREVGLPDVAGYFRAQICSHDTNKIRAVWGYPVSVIIEEGRMFYPYMKVLKTMDAPIAYRVEMATGGMAYINDMCSSHPGSTYLMIDYKQFDRTVPPWLIRDAFQIVMDCFHLDRVVDSEGKVWPVNSDRTIRRFKRMVSYFINTPVRMPTGERFRKSGGVPSGSMWTNIIDTIVNCIVTRYCGYVLTGYLPAGDMYLGDDGFIATYGVVSVDDFADLAMEKFGMEVNRDKTYATTNRMNIQFLGYMNRNGLPYKGNSFLVASFVMPERIVSDNETRVARAIGQMWSTMHGGQAYRWYQMIRHMMADYSIDPKDMAEWMKARPGMFKYLRMLGIDVTKIGMPITCGEYVVGVDPPLMSLRDYHPRAWDMSSLKEAAKHLDFAEDPG
nr:MAG: RNA-dependent RNA polymerase [Partitiviridae-like virus 3]